MIDLLKKATYIGLGFAAMSKDKIEEFAKDLSKNTDLSEEEGKKLMQELIEESKNARGNLENRFSNIMEKILQRMDIPTREEYEDLKKRVEKLEEKK